ncbi:PEP-CTERM system histidine kinase PrsK [Photobacterium sp. BZF1]|uniref:XrtA/PEP-CTERM system histidine kinase PrsK n=1 Tax=Photobacterium sp. BZF1 TaxID=1904457 RepID=UPI001653DE92|nr:PEP-CTERM system histidine kinase PrsK [Photobacterium sp. BZF1]
MEDYIGHIGYFLTALLYLLLFFLLLTTNSTNPQRYLLIYTSALSFLWSSAFVIQEFYPFSMGYFFAFETAKNIAWLLLIFSTINRTKMMSSFVFVGRELKIFLMIILSLSFIDIFIYKYFASLSLLFLYHLVQSLFALWLVEQLYRQTDKKDKWRIKPLCIGLGLIFCYDFALYSDALLVNQLESYFLYGRGWVSIFSVPLIILSARRVKDWSTRIFISREVLYHSTLLIVSGSYLLAMASVGYLFKYIGSAWTEVIQYVFFSLSGVVLASLFLSDNFRSKIKVLISKHFYANKYEYRSEWLNFVSVLEDKDKSPFDISLEAMMKPFNCEYGAYAVFENNRFTTMSAFNIDTSEIDKVLNEIGKKVIDHKWIADVNELINSPKKSPFVCDNKNLSEVKNIKYAIPVITASGHKGICLLSTIPGRKALDWEDRDLMWALSKQLSVYLNLHYSNIKLAESKQFDAFNQMSTFLVHDLKNVLAQLELLEKNSKLHKNNPEFIDDAFITISSATSRLNKVVSHLKSKTITTDNLENIDINKVIADACTERSISLPEPDLSVGFEESVLVKTNRERLKNVFIHLIQNAQDATDPSGYVKVTRIKKKGFYGVSIEDNGVGMSKEFINDRLFKPFYTTKGNAGMGVGAYDAKKMIEQMNGYIEVFSIKGKGSRFNIYIPTS